jgi:ribosomal protein S18 acetylase RimI-like enzyme
MSVPLLNEQFRVVGQQPIIKRDHVRLEVPEIAQVVLLDPSAVPQIADLHHDVRDALDSDEQTFMLEKSQAEFRKLFANSQNTVVGIVNNQGILVAKSHIVCPNADEPYSWHPGVTPVAPDDQIAVTQGVCVLPSYRGNELMTAMLVAFQRHAQSQGKTHLVAEVEPHNTHSLDNFLEAGFRITGAGVDPADGAEVLIVANEMGSIYRSQEHFCQHTYIDQMDFPAHQQVTGEGYEGISRWGDSVIYVRNRLPGLYMSGR